MSDTVLTIILAFVVIVLALLGLGIGWLLTGKSKLRSSCGQDPNKRAGSCKSKSSCSICNTTKREEKE